jgi:hypothetical protein
MKIMLKLLIRLFGGKIVGAAATWMVTMVTLGVVQALGYVGTHGLGWLVGGWNAGTIAHVILTAVVGATINHLGNLAGGSAGLVMREVAAEVEARPDAVLRAKAVGPETQ